MSLWYEDAEDEPRPVRYEPCAVFRIPVEGDRLTCADCGWWIEEHQSFRDIALEDCE